MLSALGWHRGAAPAMQGVPPFPGVLGPLVAPATHPPTRSCPAWAPQGAAVPARHLALSVPTCPPPSSAQLLWGWEGAGPGGSGGEYFF